MARTQGIYQIRNTVNGENCHNSRLTVSDIPKIRDMYATERYTLGELATIFGLKSSTAIREVIFGDSWNHVTGGAKTSFKGKPGAKISEREVIEIRRMYATKKFTQKEIGNLFGLKPNSVSMIITRKNWKDI